MSTYIERPRYQCALGGALVTINAIEGAAAIIHASPGCGVSSESAATVGSGYWGSTTHDGRATPCTNMVEREIIFGGEERLAEQIGATFDVVNADIFAVITGCMTDIIGDDVKAVVGEYQRLGKPVIVAETGGFKGDSAVGYDLVWEALITQYVQKGLPKDPKLVNIFGLVPAQDVFWRGNLIELKRLLGLLGIRANTFLTPFDNIVDLKESSRASLNIVFSDVHGIKAASVFSEVHDTPYISEPLPFGPIATERFLHRIAELFSVDSRKVKRALAAERAYYYRFINPLTDIYNDQDFQRFGVIVGNANYAYAVTRFIADELGWIPYATAITDQLTDDDKATVRARFDLIEPEVKPKLIFETDTTRIQERLREELAKEDDPYGTPISPAFVLGSTLDRPLAAELKAGFWPVSYPIVNRVVTDQGYVGYSGGLHLATEILSALMGNR